MCHDARHRCPPIWARPIIWADMGGNMGGYQSRSVKVSHFWYVFPKNHDFFFFRKKNFRTISGVSPTLFARPRVFFDLIFSFQSVPDVLGPRGGGGMGRAPRSRAGSERGQGQVLDDRFWGVGVPPPPRTENLLNKRRSFRKSNRSKNWAK